MNLERSRLCLALVIVYLTVSTAVVGYRGASIVIDNLSNTFDTPVFLVSSRMVFDGHGRYLYDLDARLDGRLPELPDPEQRLIGQFFNPPLLTVFYAPVRNLKFREAKLLLTIASALCAVGIVFVCRAWTKSWLNVGIAALALASFYPLYASLWAGNPALVLALFTSLAVLFSLRGEAEGSSKTGPLFVGLLGLKPTLILAPIAVYVRHFSKGTLVATFVALLLIALLPFFLFSRDAFGEYLRLLSSISKDGYYLFPSRTLHSSGAYWMFNWNGFWARLLAADPPLLLVYGCSAVTVFLAVRVWLVDSLIEGWLALSLATVLVLPHGFAYDWVPILPIAFAALLTRPSTPLLLLLLGLHLAINVSALQVPVNNPDLRVAFYPAQPFALILLAWLGWHEAIGAAWSRKSDPRVPAGPRSASTEARPLN